MTDRGLRVQPSGEVARGGVTGLRGGGEGVDSQGRVTSLLSGVAAAGLFYDGKCAGESCC